MNRAIFKVLLLAHCSREGFQNTKASPIMHEYRQFLAKTKEQHFMRSNTSFFLEMHCFFTLSSEVSHILGLATHTSRPVPEGH